MNNQQMAQLLCPLCPQPTPFGDRHELTLHLSSAKHLDCSPYPCRVCGTRFGSHQSLREHYWRAHPGLEVELNYEPQSAEELQKRAMVKKWVCYAMAVQKGLIQPAEEGPSELTEIPNGPVMGQQQVPNRQPTPAALVLKTIPEPNTAVPQAAHPVESGDVIACADCHEPIPATYLKQCQHVLHNHSGYSETNFKAILPRCFPEAREFDNMTVGSLDPLLRLRLRQSSIAPSALQCLDCGMVLTGKKASQEQSEHVESHHLSEFGVRLHCTVTDCPDADVIQQTRTAVLRHLKQYHGGVLGLNREAKKAYNQMRKEAEQTLERMTRRFFPFTPPDVAVNRRRHRPSNDGGAVEGGQPAEKRIQFDMGDEHESGGFDNRDATQPLGDDGATTVVDGNLDAAGDDNAAGDDDDEEEDGIKAFFTFTR